MIYFLKYTPIYFNKKIWHLTAKKKMVISHFLFSNEANLK